MAGEDGPGVGLGQDTEEDGIVHSGVGEKVFVFSGEDGLANHFGNVFILDDLPPFAGQLDQNVTLRVVDMANGGRLKANESVQVRQIRPTKVDIEENKNRGN